MNRIDEHLGAVKKAGKKALIGFLTAGDPNLEFTKKAVKIMQEEGTDLIEIGVPFSDPSADGVTIQKADIRALKQGVDIFKVFDMTAEIRNDVTVPLVYLLYYNVIVQYGVEKFFKRCAEVGVDGLIIPDLPYEESDEIAEYTEKYGVYQINLVSPTSRDRIKRIAENSKGFLYCVSSLGVTGEKSTFNTDFEGFFGEINKYAKIPACVGFGISNGEAARRLSKYCDGVIVGSAIVSAIASGETDAERESALRAKIKDLRGGID